MRMGLRDQDLAWRHAVIVSWHQGPKLLHVHDLAVQVHALRRVHHGHTDVLPVTLSRCMPCALRLCPMCTGVALSVRCPRSF